MKYLLHLLVIINVILIVYALRYNKRNVITNNVDEGFSPNDFIGQFACTEGTNRECTNIQKIKMVLSDIQFPGFVKFNSTTGVPGATSGDKSIILHASNQSSLDFRIGSGSGKYRYLFMPSIVTRIRIKYVGESSHIFEENNTGSIRNVTLKDKQLEELDIIEPNPYLNQFESMRTDTTFVYPIYVVLSKKNSIDAIVNTASQSDPDTVKIVQANHFRWNGTDVTSIDNYNNEPVVLYQATNRGGVAPIVIESNQIGVNLGNRQRVYRRAYTANVHGYFHRTDRSYLQFGSMYTDMYDTNAHIPLAQKMMNSVFVEISTADETKKTRFGYDHITQSSSKINFYTRSGMTDTIKYEYIVVHPINTTSLHYAKLCVNTDCVGAESAKGNVYGGIKGLRSGNSAGTTYYYPQERILNSHKNSKFAAYVYDSSGQIQNKDTIGPSQHITNMNARSYLTFFGTTDNSVPQNLYVLTADDLKNSSNLSWVRILSNLTNIGLTKLMFLTTDVPAQYANSTNKIEVNNNSIWRPQANNLTYKAISKDVVLRDRDFVNEFNAVQDMRKYIQFVNNDGSDNWKLWMNPDDDARFGTLNMKNKFNKFKFCDTDANQEVLMCKKDFKDIDDRCKKEGDCGDCKEYKINNFADKSADHTLPWSDLSSVLPLTTNTCVTLKTDRSDIPSELNVVRADKLNWGQNVDEMNFTDGEHKFKMTDATNLGGTSTNYIEGKSYTDTGSMRSMAMLSEIDSAIADYTSLVSAEPAFGRVDPGHDFVKISKSALVNGIAVHMIFQLPRMATPFSLNFERKFSTFEFSDEASHVQFCRQSWDDNFAIKANCTQDRYAFDCSLCTVVAKQPGVTSYTLPYGGDIRSVLVLNTGANHPHIILDGATGGNTKYNRLKVQVAYRMNWSNDQVGKIFPGRQTLGFTTGGSNAIISYHEHHNTAKNQNASVNRTYRDVILAEAKPELRNNVLRFVRDWGKIDERSMVFNLDRGLRKIQILDLISQTTFWYNLGPTVTHVIFCEQNFSLIKQQYGVTSWSEVYRNLRVSETQYSTHGRNCSIINASVSNQGDNFAQFDKFEPKAMAVFKDDGSGSDGSDTVCTDSECYVQISNKNVTDRDNLDDNDLLLKIQYADEMNWNDRVQRIEIANTDNTEYEIFELNDFTGTSHIITETSSISALQRMSSIRIKQNPRPADNAYQGLADKNIIRLREDTTCLPNDPKCVQIAFKFDDDSGKIKKLDMDNNYTHFKQSGVDKVVYCEKDWWDLNDRQRSHCAECDTVNACSLDDTKGGDPDGCSKHCDVRFGNVGAWTEFNPGRTVSMGRGRGSRTVGSVRDDLSSVKVFAPGGAPVGVQLRSKDQNIWSDITVYDADKFDWNDEVRRLDIFNQENDKHVVFNTNDDFKGDNETYSQLSEMNTVNPNKQSDYSSVKYQVPEGKFNLTTNKDCIALIKNEGRTDEEQLVFIPQLDLTDGQTISKKGLRKLNFDNTYESFKFIGTPGTDEYVRFCKKNYLELQGKCGSGMPAKECHNCVFYKFVESGSISGRYERNKATNNWNVYTMLSNTTIELHPEIIGDLSSVAFVTIDSAGNVGNVIATGSSYVQLNGRKDSNNRAPVILNVRHADRMNWGSRVDKISFAKDRLNNGTGKVNYTVTAYRSEQYGTSYSIGSPSPSGLLNSYSSNLGLMNSLEVNLDRADRELIQPELNFITFKHDNGRRIVLDFPEETNNIIEVKATNWEHQYDGGVLYINDVSKLPNADYYVKYCNNSLGEGDTEKQCKDGLTGDNPRPRGCNDCKYVKIDKTRAQTKGGQSLDLNVEGGGRHLRSIVVVDNENTVIEKFGGYIKLIRKSGAKIKYPQYIHLKIAERLNWSGRFIKYINPNGRKFYVNGNEGGIYKAENYGGGNWNIGQVNALNDSQENFALISHNINSFKLMNAAILEPEQPPAFITGYKPQYYEELARYTLFKDDDNRKIMFEHLTPGDGIPNLNNLWEGQISKVRCINLKGYAIRLSNKRLGEDGVNKSNKLNRYSSVVSISSNNHIITLSNTGLNLYGNLKSILLYKGSNAIHSNVELSECPGYVVLYNRQSVVQIKVKVADRLDWSDETLLIRSYNRKVHVLASGANYGGAHTYLPTFTMTDNIYPYITRDTHWNKIDRLSSIKWEPEANYRYIHLRANRVHYEPRELPIFFWHGVNGGYTTEEKRGIANSSTFSKTPIGQFCKDIKLGDSSTIYIPAFQKATTHHFKKFSIAMIFDFTTTTRSNKDILKVGHFKFKVNGSGQFVFEMGSQHVIPNVTSRQLAPGAMFFIVIRIDGRNVQYRLRAAANNCGSECRSDGTWTASHDMGVHGDGIDAYECIFAEGNVNDIKFGPIALYNRLVSLNNMDTPAVRFINWNHSDFMKTYTPANYQIMNNIEPNSILHPNIQHVTPPNGTLQNCKARCNARSDCIGFTKSRNDCWLKRKQGTNTDMKFFADSAAITNYNYYHNPANGGGIRVPPGISLRHDIGKPSGRFPQNSVNMKLRSGTQRKFNSVADMWAASGSWKAVSIRKWGTPSPETANGISTYKIDVLYTTSHIMLQDLQPDGNFYTYFETPPNVPYTLMNNLQTNQYVHSNIGTETSLDLNGCKQWCAIKSNCLGFMYKASPRRCEFKNKAVGNTNLSTKFQDKTYTGFYHKDGSTTGYAHSPFYASHLTPIRNAMGVNTARLENKILISGTTIYYDYISQVASAVSGNSWKACSIQKTIVPHNAASNKHKIKVIYTTTQIYNTSTSFRHDTNYESYMVPAAVLPDPGQITGFTRHAGRERTTGNNAKGEYATAALAIARIIHLSTAETRWKSFTIKKETGKYKVYSNDSIVHNGAESDAFFYVKIIPETYTVYVDKKFINASTTGFVTRSGSDSVARTEAESICDGRVDCAGFHIVSHERIVGGTHWVPMHTAYMLPKNASAQQENFARVNTVPRRASTAYFKIGFTPTPPPPLTLVTPNNITQTSARIPFTSGTPAMIRIQRGNTYVTSNTTNGVTISSYANASVNTGYVQVTGLSANTLYTIDLKLLTGNLWVRIPGNTVRTLAPLPPPLTLGTVVDITQTSARIPITSTTNPERIRIRRTVSQIRWTTTGQWSGVAISSTNNASISGKNVLVANLSPRTGYIIELKASTGNWVATPQSVNTLAPPQPLTLATPNNITQTSARIPFTSGTPAMIRIQRHAGGYKWLYVTSNTTNGVTISSTTHASVNTGYVQVTGLSANTLYAIDLKLLTGNLWVRIPGNTVRTLAPALAPKPGAVTGYTRTDNKFQGSNITISNAQGDNLNTVMDVAKRHCDGMAACPAFFIRTQNTSPKYKAWRSNNADHNTTNNQFTFYRKNVTPVGPAPRWGPKMQNKELVNKTHIGNVTATSRTPSASKLIEILNLGRSADILAISFTYNTWGGRKYLVFKNSISSNTVTRNSNWHTTYIKESGGSTPSPPTPQPLVLGAVTHIGPTSARVPFTGGSPAMIRIQHLTNGWKWHAASGGANGVAISSYGNATISGNYVQVTGLFANTLQVIELKLSTGTTWVRIPSNTIRTLAYPWDDVDRGAYSSIGWRPKDISKVNGNWSNYTSDEKTMLSFNVLYENDRGFTYRQGTSKKRYMVFKGGIGHLNDLDKKRNTFELITPSGRTSAQCSMQLYTGDYWGGTRRHNGQGSDRYSDIRSIRLVGSNIWGCYVRIWDEGKNWVKAEIFEASHLGMNDSSLRRLWRGYRSDGQYNDIVVYENDTRRSGTRWTTTPTNWRGKSFSMIGGATQGFSNFGHINKKVTAIKVNGADLINK